MAYYFLLAKSNFVSNQETKFQDKKDFSDFFQQLLCKRFISMHLPRKEHMNGAVQTPCIFVGVSLFYRYHCDLEGLL